MQKKHPPVKIFVGIIFHPHNIQKLEKIKAYLKQSFGKIEYTSVLFDFKHTDYYENEFGQNLKKIFYFFHKLRDVSGLQKIKLLTNKLEKKFSEKQQRLFNIDPGYLTDSKIVLFTTKNYTHRLYIYNNIYAEVTLKYYKNSYQPWEWTYPDYKTGEYISIFNAIRNEYLSQISKS